MEIGDKNKAKTQTFKCEHVLVYIIPVQRGPMRLKESGFTCVIKIIIFKYWTNVKVIIYLFMSAVPNIRVRYHI